MGRVLRANRSTLAIVTAVLAACGGAVSVGPLVDEGTDGGVDEDARVRSDGAAADDGAVDGANVVDGATLDASAEAWPVEHCPPPNDPYWDAVFQPSDAGGSYGWQTSTWDGSVCGVYKAGFYGGDHAIVNGDVACALSSHGLGDAGGDASCPAAICPTRVDYVLGRCTVVDAGVGASPLLDQAGNCTVGSDKTYEVYCGNVMGGRPPRGWSATRQLGRPGAGTALACQAELEAASVVAFEDLAAELQAFGAPDDLVTDCLEAAREEAEHARIAARLAARFGTNASYPAATSARRRTIEQLAIDNAVDGLVNETVAAAIALHQARMASPGLRDDLRRIARDEISHAALSRRIHAWAIERIDAEDRMAVARAMKGAIDEMAVTVGRDGDTHRSAPEIGMPNREAGRKIFGTLVDTLWSDELAALSDASAEGFATPT